MTTTPQEPNGSKATIREVYALIETVETRVLARIDKVEQRLGTRLDDHDRKHTSTTRFWVTSVIAIVALGWAVGSTFLPMMAG